MSQAKRYNEGKPDLHYLHTWFDALCEVSHVCMKGGEKYERGNYLLGQPYSELLGAAERHLMKFGSPDYPDSDPESGQHHIAHAIWNLLQLLQTDVQFPGRVRSRWDDRLRVPGPGPDGDKNPTPVMHNDRYCKEFMDSCASELSKRPPVVVDVQDPEVNVEVPEEDAIQAHVHDALARRPWA